MPLFAKTSLYDSFHSKICFFASFNRYTRHLHQQKTSNKFRSFQEYASGVRHTDLTHDGSLMEVNTIIKSVSNIITSACNILITCLLIQDALSSFLFSFLVLSVDVPKTPLREQEQHRTRHFYFIFYQAVHVLLATILKMENCILVLWLENNTSSPSMFRRASNKSRPASVNNMVGEKFWK